MFFVKGHFSHSCSTTFFIFKRWDLPWMRCCLQLTSWYLKQFQAELTQADMSLTLIWWDRRDPTQKLDNSAPGSLSHLFQIVGVKFLLAHWLAKQIKILFRYVGMSPMFEMFSSYCLLFVLQSELRILGLSESIV